MRINCVALRAILLSVLCASCIRVGSRGASVSVPVPASTMLESTEIRRSMPQREGRLTIEQLDSLQGAIAALRADPAELHATVGDTVRVGDLVRVLAVDTTGAIIGEIPVYDFSYQGGRFRLLSDGGLLVRGRGTIRFTALLGKQFRTASSERLSASVVILVH